MVRNRFINYQGIKYINYYHNKKPIDDSITSRTKTRNVNVSFSRNVIRELCLAQRKINIKTGYRQHICVAYSPLVNHEDCIDTQGV